LYFVNRNLSWRRKDFLLIHWAPTLVIFLSISGFTLFSWQAAKNRAYHDRQEIINNNLNTLIEDINTNVAGYENILRGAAGLFRSSDDVTRAEWKTFTDSIDFKNRLPGVQGLGYTAAIPAGNLNTHIASVRSSGLPNYSIKPGGKRPIYTSLLYRESKDSPNSIDKSLGMDFYTDSVRKKAIDQALSTGTASPTSKVYPTTSSGLSQPTFVVYYPVFPGDKTTGTLEESNGLVHLSVQANDLFNDLLQNTSQGFGYRIYLDEPNDENTIFQSSNFTDIAGQEESQSLTKNLAINEVDWTIEVNASTETGNPELQNRPENILVAGIILAILTSALVYILLHSRTRSVSIAEERELQEAKDELLALASHQLRTPATGVKQYIGMLREGFAGEMTSEQKKIVEKANESNERQLVTINEMLSVARADTGRLSMERQPTNLNRLIEDTINEQQEVIDKREQKLSLKMPKQVITAHVDPQYFRMAIENLLNNASKYTPERGDIDVRLSTQNNTAQILIQDTGVGIPERHFPLLFKKFSRIPNELSDQVSGTGIGLYLSKYIVEAHGGKLQFKSESGVGSSFTISLSLKKKRTK
jgi:two-component system, OmpR family, sensor kinase